MRRLRLHPAILRAGLLSSITIGAWFAAATARPVSAEAALPVSRQEPAPATPATHATHARPARPLSARGARSMIALPAGTFRQLYSSPDDVPARVPAFRLDRDPVTRGEFLAFVHASPEWRRSAVPADLAERDGYLADWRGDHDAGDAAALRRPVTGVSWFAADAYCAAQGKRLPTMLEWEYAAAASETARDAARDRRFVQHLVSRYASRPRTLPDVATGTVNAYGVRGLHDFAWEWTADDAHAGHASHDAHRGAQRDTIGTARAHDLSCAGAAIGAIDPTNYPAFLRYAVRSGLTGRTNLSTLGFRCAL